MPSAASTSHMGGFHGPLLQGSGIKDEDMSVNTSVMRAVEEDMGTCQCRRVEGRGEVE